MLINEIFEKKQTIVNYKVKDLLKMLSENRLTLRETNKVQVRMIRKYLFDNILTKEIYMPPIVAMLKKGSLSDGKPTQLTIIDGSQRLKALSQLGVMISKAIQSEDEEERKKGFKLNYSLDEVEVAVQIFEGFSTAEANQLYIDLNTKGKKVALSKRIAYDSRNEINQTTNQVLSNNEQLRRAGVEQEKNAVMRPKNKNLLSLSQLRQLVTLFITGKAVTSNATLDTIKLLPTEENIDLINTWFEELFKLYPVSTIGDYNKSMLASFPLLLAVVNYAIEDTEELSFFEKKKRIIERMRGLKKVDWTRESTVWREFSGSERGRDRYFYLDNNKRNIRALIAWLQLKGGE